MLFVSSWDDGHPLDLKIAEMYAERGLRATFYVPLRNREGRAVLSPSDLRSLDKSGFEIGSHTADHCYLDSVSNSEAADQILGGKHGLEDIIGREVRGFCYPGGRTSSTTRQLLARAEIGYARTVENLRTDRDFDRYRVPTTFQFYPHTSATLIRNALKSPNHLLKKMALIQAQRSSGDRLSGILNVAAAGRDAYEVFHLWGHSWEVDRLNGWKELGRLLDTMKSRAQSATVAELVASRYPGISAWQR